MHNYILHNTIFVYRASDEIGRRGKLISQNELLEMVFLRFLKRNNHSLTKLDRRTLRETYGIPLVEFTGAYPNHAFTGRGERLMLKSLPITCMYAMLHAPKNYL